MTRDELTIIGAGTYGEVIAELATECGYRVINFFDDEFARWPDRRPRVVGPILAKMKTLPQGSNIAVAIGANGVRLALLRRADELGLSVPSLVSPGAWVSPSAKIGLGVFLHRGCHVWTRAAVGFGTILSPHATVAHHSIIGRACLVSTGANIGASVRVGDCVTFGMNATVITGVASVSPGTVVGAGAVVIRDTEERGVYVGVPARLVKYSNQQQLMGAEEGG